MIKKTFFATKIFTFAVFFVSVELVFLLLPIPISILHNAMKEAE